MGEAKLDPDGLLQLTEQMVSVLEEKVSTQSSFWGELKADLFGINLACQEDHVELLTIIEDLQKQIAVAEHALQEACLIDQSGPSEDDLRKHRDTLLQRERLLKEEERSLQNMLEDLSKQRETLQSQKDSLKKLDTEMQRNQTVMALCASTFHMIPSDEGDNRVAGNLVDSKGFVVDTFGFNTEDMNAFDVCEKLWNLCMTS